jgi:arylsulfatase A-like enzyme
MSKKLFLVLATMSLILVLSGCSGQTTPAKPNLVIIYMDDLGYGDVSAYSAGTLQTPNIDQLASEGMRFTSGYCTSATCTPSRYGMLTGQYPWRNQRAAILAGDAPLLIDPKQPTLPKMLAGNGYRTAVIGKWHLGIGDGSVDWNESIELTPNAVGFEYSYVMAATNDRVPTVYVENHKVAGLSPDDPLQVSYKENFEGEPTGRDNPEMLKLKWHHGHNHSIWNGIPRIGYQKGGKSAMWIDGDMADNFLDRALKYIEDNKDETFFLYYALQQPHVPRTPHPRFEGVSGMGPRGDAIVEADWCVGQVMAKLKELNLDENTLVVFSSDNGPVLNDGYYDDAVEKVGDHTPSGPYRGGKYSLFNAGTNVPFVTRWPGQIQPGVSDALVCQIDLMASLASYLGIENTGPDSQDILDALLGRSEQGRQNLVLEASRRVAFRSGNYMLIPPYEGNPVSANVNIETGLYPEYQLYDINVDPGQMNNLAGEMPERVNELKDEFASRLGKK